ncbi:MAG: hypothetical protein HOO97_12535, partial [Sideroxydans sp.]|nr:hypothetical protein [Sideroxydans sp.]
STLAGTAGVAGSADGAGAAAHFEAPTGISLDSTGNLYVTDSNNNNIRKITPAGVVSTLAGRAGESGSADGTVAAARFNGPMGISVAPNGNLYVADYVNHTIRKIGPGYYVGGTVSGLKGALILRNSNGDTKTINAYGKFTLDTPVAEGLTYAVTVQTQPPGQTCTVTGGSGTATDHVSNIDVSCTGTAVTAYTIGGTVSGLTGKLVLQNSNGDKKTIDANSSFTFTARVVTGGAYKVTVLTDPVGQTCTVSSGSGTASATVNNVSVSCAASTYTIGGTVSGLTAGTLVLQNNTSDNLTLMTNGNFTFATAITHGRAYAVTVLTQPTGQTCTVRDALSANASGTARVNVATITVSCVTNTYTIGGTVSGLTAGTLVLQNNGGDNKSLTADGNFTFTTPVTGAYSVTVLTQPAGQTCTVTSGSGTAAANVSNVAVSCANNPAPTYTIGGAVSGLTGTLVLQNNAGDNLSLTTNASFTFATPVTGAYSVTVLTQPAGQTCSMTSGSGTAAANVSNVAVSCSSNGSSATTLAGSGMLGSADGTGVAASFDTPFGITSDSAGNLYVTDSFGQIIRKTTPAGVVSTIAGTVATPGSADGTGAAASFSFPQGVAVDSAGNLFVADSGNHTIRKITSAGVVSTIAGTAGGFGSVDGTGAAARFIGPGGIAVDSAGNLFVADSGNHTIRKITSAGVVTTVAGSAVTPGITDGTGAVARFNGPGGIAIDATGNLFVADTGNHTIRKITSAGVVTTVAGTAGLSGSTDATGTATKFNTPFGVTVDSAGNLFVADTYNNTIRKIDTLGVVTTVAGTAGVSGSTNATGAAASFSSPTHITVDPAGNLFVTDMGNNMIRKVTP